MMFPFPGSLLIHCCRGLIAFNRALCFCAKNKNKAQQNRELKLVLRAQDVQAKCVDTERQSNCIRSEVPGD